MENQSLFGILGLVVVLIVLLWSFRRLRMIIIKKIYGRYSEKYIELYKKMTLKSPYSYCLKDDLINYIYKTVILDKKHPFYKTDQEIKFGEDPFFISTSKLFKIKGEPDCANVFNIDSDEVKIFGFKSNIQGTSVRSLYFFLKDQFFMGQYTYKPTLQMSENQAFNALLSKYIKNNHPEDKSFYIENNKRRIFYENNGFSVSIRYINFEDESLQSKLQEYCRRFEGLGNPEENVVEDDWISKI